jgi:hypothetical protein
MLHKRRAFSTKKETPSTRKKLSQPHKRFFQNMVYMVHLKNLSIIHIFHKKKLAAMKTCTKERNSRSYLHAPVKETLSIS